MCCNIQQYDYSVNIPIRYFIYNKNKMPTRKVEWVIYNVVFAKTIEEMKQYLVSLQYVNNELSWYNKELWIYEYLFSTQN